MSKCVYRLFAVLFVVMLVTSMVGVVCINATQTADTDIFLMVGLIAVGTFFITLYVHTMMMQIALEHS